MHRTLDYIESYMRVTGGEGFWHELPPNGWRQQNPHMHLTEACLAAFEATGEARFPDLAREIADVFSRRFFDLESRTLAEYFTEDLRARRAMTGASSNRAPVRMGLDPEFVPQAFRPGSCPADTRACRLRRASWRRSEATGVTFNVIRDDGTLIDRGSRTWPNCERIKAAIALSELDGADAAPMAGSSARLLLERYLTRTPAGAWIDQFDADGKPVAGNVPASTLYHILLAFAELLRVAEA